MSSKIEWTQETWNPIIGCNKTSPGCSNCYAERMAGRLSTMPQGYEYKNVLTSVGGWNSRTIFRPGHLDRPSRWKKPRMIFVCSMGDLFHKTVQPIWLAMIFKVFHDNPRHTFLVLTKRPDIALMHMENLMLKDTFGIKNLWIGVTAENQEEADIRIPLLLAIPAVKRFVSIEPQLGPVDLSSIQYLDWVICGAESGPGRRPFNEDWARILRNQCKEAGVPFFYKQRFDDGKKISLPELDGVTYNQMP